MTITPKRQVHSEVSVTAIAVSNCTRFGFRHVRHCLKSLRCASNIGSCVYVVCIWLPDCITYYHYNICTRPNEGWVLWNGDCFGNCVLDSVQHRNRMIHEPSQVLSAIEFIASILSHRTCIRHINTAIQAKHLKNYLSHVIVLWSDDSLFSV